MVNFNIQVQPAVPGLLLYQNVAYIRPYFPPGQAIQKLADLTATALRDKCFYPVSRDVSREPSQETRGKGLKGNLKGGAIDQPLFPHNIADCNTSDVIVKVWPYGLVDMMLPQLSSG
jgi:hypothetical protein